MLTGDSWTIHVVQLAVLMWCLLRGVWGTLCFDLLTRSCVRLEKQEWRSWQDHFLPTLHRALSGTSSHLSFPKGFLSSRSTHPPLWKSWISRSWGGWASVVYTSCFDQHRAHFFRETVVVFCPQKSIFWKIPLEQQNPKSLALKESDTVLLICTTRARQESVFRVGYPTGLCWVRANVLTHVLDVWRFFSEFSGLRMPLWHKDSCGPCSTKKKRKHTLTNWECHLWDSGCTVSWGV